MSEISGSFADDAVIVALEQIAAVAAILLVGYGYTYYKDRKRRKEIKLLNDWFALESPE
jgi:hypothetical protein